MSEPSQGIALILAYALGIFGADKFYIGLTTQGIIMLVLSITVIGLFVTVPWTYVSCLLLIISILWNSTPMLYPKDIKWAPITQTDKIIAWAIVGITLLGMIVPLVLQFFIKKDSYQQSVELSVKDTSETNPETNPETDEEDNDPTFEQLQFVIIGIK